LAASPLEFGAMAILLVAAVALAAALAAAARQPGGLWSIFGGRRPDTRDSGQETADELRTLIAEARRLSDELADRFDGRAADLARLMREADLRAARLEQVLRAESAPPPHAHPSNPGAEPARSQPRATGVVEPAPGRATAGGSLPGGSAAVPMLSGDPMAHEIYRLSDEGLPPVEIASRLGQHTGKVELILALRRA
jgi:hypothetical protein